MTRIIWNISLFSLAIILTFFFSFGLHSEELSDLNTESLESVSESAAEASQSLESVVEPTESLDSISQDPDKISEQLPAGGEESGVTDEIVPQKKPLGVREAEGKVIGE